MGFGSFATTPLTCGVSSHPAPLSQGSGVERADMAKRFTLKSIVDGRIHDGSFVVDDTDVAVVRRKVLRWHKIPHDALLEVQVVQNTLGRSPEGLHRVLMQANPGQVVMFRDGDYTNMRRANMSLGSPKELAVKANKARRHKAEVA